MQPGDDTLNGPAPTPAPRRLRGTRSLRVALVIAVTCAVALLALINQSYQKFIDLNGERIDIQAIRESVDAVNNQLDIAESALRAILLTDEPVYHQRFDRTEGHVRELLAQLTASAAHTPLDAGPLSAFGVDARRRMTELSRVVQLARSGKPEAALFAGTSEAAMELRASGERIMADADALITDKNRDFARFVNYFRLAFLAAVMALLSGFVLYIQQRFRLREADLHERQLLLAQRNELESEVRRRTHALAMLATYLQEAVENERARLARELHDELGALMTAAKLDVARLRSRLAGEPEQVRERLEHLRDSLNQAIALKRRIMEGLYPSALRNLGLVPALEILLREFAQASGLQMQVQLQAVELDPGVELTIYRMVQEALTNIGKYARAGRVSVDMRVEAGRVRVGVCDDGVGFDPQPLAQGTHGLAGMRHRLLSCGGELQLKTRPGAGCELIALIPLTAGAPA
ncbi:histidine kinase [Comamonas flocculans]|uniref:Histidine kinase n=1 Tax=Comamonas flocculans TaxID=2597701 RepID=A0A5B8RY14_9BURK|nr:histidine kinase [Comamonas flocculans]QEA12747.1 histidine kinase [Comamonas flocculans]